MYTIVFEGGESVEGFKTWEDCLAEVQSREASKHADWKRPKWQDGLPPLSDWLFFDPDTGKTVATVYRDA